MGMPPDVTICGDCGCDINEHTYQDAISQGYPICQGKYGCRCKGFFYAGHRWWLSKDGPPAMVIEPKPEQVTPGYLPCCGGYGTHKRHGCPVAKAAAS